MFFQLLNINDKEQHSCSEEIWKAFFPFFLCGKVLEYLTAQEIFKWFLLWGSGGSCVTGFTVWESLDVFRDYLFRFQFFMRQAVHVCLHSFMSHNGSHCEFIAKETSSNFQMPAIFLKLLWNAILIVLTFHDSLGKCLGWCVHIVFTYTLLLYEPYWYSIDTRCNINIQLVPHCIGTASNWHVSIFVR